MNSQTTIADDESGNDGSSSDVKQDYNQWHAGIAETEAEDHTSAPWHLMVKPHLGDLSGMRVLEIGCGRGGFARYLQGLGADLVAADFSETAVEVATRILGDLPHCEARVIDIQDIPYPDNSFDMIVSLETLEHVPDPFKGLSELVRVTKPGGKLVITTPNYYGLLGLHRSWREATGRPYTEHGQPINNPLKVKDRVRQLQKLGCVVETVEGRGHYLPVPRLKSVALKGLDRPDFMKWFAAHALTIAIKKIQR